MAMSTRTLLYKLIHARRSFTRQGLRDKYGVSHAVVDRIVKQLRKMGKIQTIVRGHGACALYEWIGK